MESSGAFETKCYAAKSGGAPLEPHTIKRRAVGDNDVHIKIKYAGICHSDIHQAREEWGPAIFPMVPGHEIAGVVEAVGKNVTKFKVGDHAGIGCFVDSCRDCDMCKAGDEQYCRKGMVGTYNSRACHAHVPGFNAEGRDHCEPTYGGYSQDIVVDENYTCKIPENLSLDKAAPLLCAGITVYSPMMYYGVKSGMKIGVAGLGGLGHMAVKIGVAMGCHVTVISRGTAKKEEAMSRLGAQGFIDSTDAGAVGAAAGSFTHIIDSISADHDLNQQLSMLDTNGTLIMLGGNVKPLPVSMFALLFARKKLGGSLIGGIKETQEMLDFCAKHNVGSDVEVIKPEQINEAYDRTMKSDVRYRFSIDVSQM